ncbi:DUF2946 family protein [Bradyrhizobium sp. LB11.1]|uniref:DUF2946 family protein n=1 Tax=Bradyrhizobium sp. LB11.1 TaxID=3156326 RepID=UPI00339B81C5
MRSRLQKFLPVVLIALAVLVLAPIAACWATAIAMSDPLVGSELCHSTPASLPGQSDQSSGLHAHGACAFCSLVHAITALDPPRMNIVTTPYRQAQSVVWHEAALEFAASRTGSNSQARAPPLPM